MAALPAPAPPAPINGVDDAAVGDSVGAHELAAGIARKPTSATQGTVRAIWESLDRPYRAAMQQGLIYTRLANPIGQAEVAENGPDRPEPRTR